MAKTLSPEQFVLKSIEVLSEEYGRGNGHHGVRKSKLEDAFDYFFGEENQTILNDTIDKLIKSHKIIAASVIWTKNGTSKRRKLTDINRLHSFPDKRFGEEDPLLYLPKKVPKRLIPRLVTAYALIEKLSETYKRS